MKITAYHQLRLDELDKISIRQSKEDVKEGFLEEAKSYVNSNVNFYKPQILLNQILFELEDYLVRRALKEAGNNKAKAARILGLNRTTLIEKLKKLGPDAPELEKIDLTDNELEIAWLTI